MPPRVPNGIPGPSQTDCASGARKLSVTGDASPAPTAYSLTRRATLRYCSSRSGDIERASPILSNPAAIPSGGSSSFTGNSIASRSRIALACSRRFRRRITGRPAYGAARAAASRSLTIPAIKVFNDAASGRGIPGGGISPAFSLRSTFSQRSGRDAGEDAPAFWSTMPAVLAVSLWQDAQYRSRKLCLESGELAADIKPTAAIDTVRAATAGNGRRLRFRRTNNPPGQVLGFHQNTSFSAS